MREAGCARVLATFGQVPFFFYVVHIYLIHALAVAAGLATDRHAREQSPGSGSALRASISSGCSVLVLLYPVCRWFAGLKQRGSGWWSYL